MAKRYLPPQNTEALVRGGLTLDQAKLYETLVQQGALNARRASFIATVPRTLAYKVLSELEQLGLILKKDEPGKVAQFAAAHPSKLKELAEKKLSEAKGASEALEGALSKLTADFDATLGEQEPLYIIKSLKNVDFNRISALLAPFGCQLVDPSPAVKIKIAELL